MRELALRVLLILEGGRYRLANRHVPERVVIADVPYFAQWESRALVAKILAGAVKAEDDPHWKASGAKSKAEYAAWSWGGCGMACLKMILAHRNGRVVPLVTLGKGCATYGGYELPLGDSIGLRYQPFVHFLQHEFGISARSAGVLSQAEIVHELARGNYVMASVHGMIRDVTSTPSSKGGHLVLVVGYDLAEKQFYMHNPSGGSATTQAYAAIQFTDFRRFFSNRGVIVF